MAGETPRKRRHLGAVVAVLLACSASFAIGAYAGASPTDPMGVRHAIGIPVVPYADTSIGAAAARTECPPEKICDPVPKCDVKQFVREVKVEKECPKCDPCPVTSTTKTKEEKHEATKQSPVEQKSEEPKETQTNPLLAAARQAKEGVKEEVTEKEERQAKWEQEGTGDTTTEQPSPGDIPKPIECPKCEACGVCEKGNCPETRRCESDDSHRNEKATCPECDPCPVCVSDGNECPKVEACR